MDHDFPLTYQPPFEDLHETSPLTQEHAVGDVVESDPALGTGVHVERVEEFATGSPRRDAPRHDLIHDDRDHHGGGARTSDHPRDHHNDRDDRDDDHRDDLDHDTTDEPDNDGLDEWSARRELLQRDRVERRLRRERARRERIERRTARNDHPRRRARRRPPRRTSHLDPQRQRERGFDARVRRRRGGGDQSVRGRRGRRLSTDPRPEQSLEHADVGTNPEHVKRTATSHVHGFALVAYFALLPYVVVTKWQSSGVENDGTLVRALLILLSVFWIGFLAQVTLNVLRLRRGAHAKGGGSAWLAGLVVALITLVLPASHPGVHQAPTASVAQRDVRARAPVTPSPLPPLSGLTSVPLALMAKRRGDLLRHDSSDFDVEESISLLRSRDPDLIATVARLAGDAREGVLEVRDGVARTPASGPLPAIVACALGVSDAGTLVSFAREGGRLPVLSTWRPDDVEERVVALHEGRVHFVRDEVALIRALATRSLRQSVVVYLGAAAELDGELAACAVTLAAVGDATARIEYDGPPAMEPVGAPSDVFVELLRADPHVNGLVEPFTPTLRRRCVEMTAYLALHRREPVTGERLRTRVLTHADVDASTRTLANTASAVRRSLGVDARGPRLHPVTSSGLYETHGLSSDVERFSSLVSQARQLPADGGADLAHQALLLVKGEPLASALRGFEWFLAEGHGARLARDGEWAALALHHASLQRANYELAFWALQQGLLIDPYSDALAEALQRVPRLREFGGDGARGPQDESVSPRGAVAMSWSFTRFSQQVTK